jgi:hypothetical protein
MGIFAEWGLIGFAVYAERLWEDVTVEAVRSYGETAERAEKEALERPLEPSKR